MFNEGSRPEAIAAIENLCLSFLHQLAYDPKIQLNLADRKKIVSDGSLQPSRSLRFPKNAKPLAQLFRVLDLVHEALVNDIPMTKRDIYYKDVSLFQKQSVVDNLIDDLAATFQLDRSDLNVRAASKGLVCGAGLVMHLASDEVVHVNDSEGTLIPVGEDIARFEVDDDITWVLVVEKEAVFQTLCKLRITNHPDLPGVGMMITGKGYPDIATRQFVKTLSDNLPSRVPIMALVDGDPYGLDILSVYRNGSRGLRHENSKLAARRVEWLGVWGSELMRLNIDMDTLIPITEHDEKKAHAMLCRDADMMPARWRKELMHMLHSRRKAEIEILSTTTKVIREPNPRSMRYSVHAPSLLEYLLAKISDIVEASDD